MEQRLLKMEQKLLTVDLAQQNSVAALQKLPADAATELTAARGVATSPTTQTPKLRQSSSKWTKLWKD